MFTRIAAPVRALKIGRPTLISRAFWPHASVVLLGLGSLASAHAAEGFQPRYNVSGSLSGEIFAANPTPGWLSGISFTRVDIHKVTNERGERITQNYAGGVIPLPAPTPAALYPRYASTDVRVDARGSLNQLNFGVGYVGELPGNRGHWLVGMSLPFSKKTQRVKAESDTPALQWSPAVPLATQQRVNQAFHQQFQDFIAQEAGNLSGEVTGWGDAELSLGWLRDNGRLRTGAGLTLIVPTGKYSAMRTSGNNDHGNFYTLRTSLQASVKPTARTSVAGKITLGLNTKNRDNQLRSGDWLALESAAGYMTPLGPVGINVLHVQQYQDDRNNPFGASRYRSTNAGFFFSTLLPVLKLPISMQVMNTIDSRSANHGRYIQFRVLKQF